MGMQTLVDKQDLHGGKATSLNKFLSPFSESASTVEGTS